MIVSDLDGTLLTVNSFPLWVKYLIRKSISALSPSILVRILMLGVLRKTGFIDHYIFKSKLASMDIPDSWNLEFSTSLTRKLNTKVLKELKGLDAFILATAAPVDYAKPLVELLFEGECVLLASEWKDSGYMDNVGVNKYSNIKQCLGSEPITCFYTDHEEDLPTMKHSKAVILVGDRICERDALLSGVNILRVIK